MFRPVTLVDLKEGMKLIKPLANKARNAFDTLQKIKEDLNTRTGRWNCLDADDMRFVNGLMTTFVKSGAEVEHGVTELDNAVIRLQAKIKAAERKDAITKAEANYARAGETLAGFAVSTPSPASDRKRPMAAAASSARQVKRYNVDERDAINEYIHETREQTDRNAEYTQFASWLRNAGHHVDLNTADPEKWVNKIKDMRKNSKPLVR